MNTIDFLPARYREKEQQRRALMWRWTLFGFFGAVVLGIAAGQASIHRSTAAALAKVEQQAAIERQAEATLDALESELADLQAYAELYTYLSHPWPRSQLLARATQSLPESMGLTELRVALQPAPSAAVNQRVAPPSQALPSQALPSQASPAHAAVADKAVLKQADDAQQLVVHLSGVTTDLPELHRFIQRLAEDSLFAAARLESVEAADKGGAGLGARFVIRALVAPGLEHPETPAAMQVAELQPTAQGAQP